MKRYIYYYRDMDDKDCSVIMTENQIIDYYWPIWAKLMIEKYGDLYHPLVTRQNCIDDWITVNWASEVIDDKNLLYPGLDHIAHFLNSLDTEFMSVKDLRSAVYKECMEPTVIERI